MSRNKSTRPTILQDANIDINHRFTILKYLTFAIFAIIVARLFFIQIIEHADWVAKAEEQHTILETIVAKRGEIYMMDGDTPVAVVLNQTAYQIIIDPAVTDRAEIQQALETYAPDYIAADFDSIYAQDGLRYAIVAKNVPHHIASQIADLGLAAVWFQSNNQRVYPEGEMASALLGFVNADGIGQYGVEGSLNDILSGKDGLLKTTADVNRVALSIGNDNTKIPAEDGANIVLSIDRGLERGVEELAAKAIDSTIATNAAALVMNPNTGEVLAMANVPNYDPANYGQVKDASAYINYALEVPYEPASICKTFTFSAAINEGVMTGDTTYFNQHYEVIDGWKIWNATTTASLYGNLTMRRALYWSLNTGSIYALKLLGGDPNNINQQGREKLYDYYYNKFRLGQPTGIELYEALGYIPDPNEGYGRDSTYANMTFGQNLGITMMQTASAFSAVVNGGTYHNPSIVKGILKDSTIAEASAYVSSEKTDSPDQENTNSTENISSLGRVSESILSPETSAMMREMLVGNRDYLLLRGVDRYGYSIGGKSGTAQVVRDGAYDDTMSELVGSYIGFVAPAGEMPQYVIMVKMWGEGQSVGSGEAMNLFSDLSNYLIDYYKIKPGNG